jgi:hypothetical protein
MLQKALVAKISANSIFTNLFTIFFVNKKGNK